MSLSCRITRVVLLLGAVVNVGAALHPANATFPLNNHTGMVKRHLRVQASSPGLTYVIKSENFNRPDLTVDKLSPSRFPSEILDNEVYMGFTLYQKQDSPFLSQTGKVYVLKLKDVDHLRCPRPTSHAKAFRYVFGHCPEDDAGVVAAGHCIQKSRHFAYNSLTFNDKGKSYADMNYYLNADRKMDETEITAHAQCLSMWMSGHTGDCQLQTLQATRALPLQDGVIVTSDCCDCGSGARSVQGSVALIVLSALLTFIGNMSQ